MLKKCLFNLAANGIKLKADRLYKRLVCGGLILGCVSGALAFTVNFNLNKKAMEWISVKKRMPNVGDVVSIYGLLHAYRENYSKGELKKTHQHDVIYYGKKSINGEPKAHWFGGWCVDDENECVSHWFKMPDVPSA